MAPRAVGFISTPAMKEDWSMVKARATLYDETRNDLPANYARRNRGKLDYRLGELVSDPAGEN